MVRAVSLTHGMTVQSDATRPHRAHYAHCVTCGWSSGFMSYQAARLLACEPCPLMDQSYRHRGTHIDGYGTHDYPQET